VTDWLVLRPPGKQPSDGGADAEEGEANDVADFLGSLDEYVPIIPDELTNQYLARAGFKCDDVTATRLVSLATQKFVSDIVFDATKVAEQRTRGGAGRGKAATQPKKQQERVSLSLDDVSSALKEYGVAVRRPEFFASRPTESAAAGVGAQVAKKK
jgi:transcription initiation factor TFIID subunit 10